MPALPDDELMRLAMAEALAAEDAGEVPVGAVVLSPEGEIIGRGNNRVIRDADPTAHAEIVAMRDAASALRNYRLTGCALICTLEPCAMCAGAMVHARLGTLVYAARDPKAGADGSVLDVLQHASLNHRVIVREGALAAECSAMLTNFFRRKRNLPLVNFASNAMTEASFHGDEEVSEEIGKEGGEQDDRT